MADPDAMAEQKAELHRMQAEFFASLLDAGIEINWYHTPTHDLRGLLNTLIAISEVTKPWADVAMWEDTRRDLMMAVRDQLPDHLSLFDDDDLSPLQPLSISDRTMQGVSILAGMNATANLILGVFSECEGLVSHDASDEDDPRWECLI